MEICGGTKTRQLGVGEIYLFVSRENKRIRLIKQSNNLSDDICSVEHATEEPSVVCLINNTENTENRTAVIFLQCICA